MTRILRRLFRPAVSGLCLMSLLAACGVGWVWRRSLCRSELVEWVHGRRAVFARTVKGGVEFGVGYELPGLPAFSWDVEEAPQVRSVWLPRSDIDSPDA